jgi:predicted  nucleic acid-binding Zn-ribbon protein
MLWKILSFLSAACLGAACFFAWSNQKDLTAERDRERFAKDNLKAAQERKTQGDEALVAKKTALEGAQKELETSKAETVKLAESALEKDGALKVVKSSLEQVEQQVSAVEKQIDEAGDIEKLIAQIDKYKKEQAEAEAAVANQSQRLAAAKEQFENVVAQTAKLRDAEARGRRGVVAPEFTARVSKFFPEWHFAILNKGNSGGVFANADLEVKRGKNVIAKLKVKNVEQNGSVAEVVPGSLAVGDMIRTGDVVVASSTQSVVKPEAALAAKPDAAAAPVPATPAPAAPAMSADPFGAAPAPAAAAPAMSADPFGAAPAPAAAPAMGADPFGAAPAPAAGTPAAPSTADPFGAAPPAAK